MSEVVGDGGRFDHSQLPEETFDLTFCVLVTIIRELGADCLQYKQWKEDKSIAMARFLGPFTIVSLLVFCMRLFLALCTGLMGALFIL